MTRASRRRADESVDARRAAAILTVTLAGAGAIHFARPQVYDPIVPRMMPGKARSWTYASGLVEWALAGLLASRRTRSLGGLLAAAFFVAVFPANVRTVRIVRKRGPLAVLIALLRLPLQIPLVTLALKAARDEPSR